MKSVALAAIALLGVDASSLRTAESSSIGASATRKLSNKLIAGYEPPSDVVDHKKIDLDQLLIEEQLRLGTPANLVAAKRVYENGANSKVLATLTLTGDGLTAARSKDAYVQGLNPLGGLVGGTLNDDYGAGTKVITIKVDPNIDTCHGNGHPAQDVSGCFDIAGTIAVAGSGVISYEYTHDPALQMTNGRTIKKFSTDAGSKMAGHKTFEKFRDYYGTPTYADEWVSAAFSGTNFGEFADFKGYGSVGREQAIKKGTAYMNVWMYVIREMEDAIDDCNAGCSAATCNDDPGVKAWDEAVAFYTGSLERTDGEGSGVLLHNLADSRAANFKTAGDLADGISGRSHVNLEIFRQFGLGKGNLAAKNCPGVRVNKERIEEMMAVPLVQGALRYSYKSAYEDYSEKSAAEFATFAQAVLPLVHACDQDAAWTIYENSKVQSTSDVDHTAVKGAFESVYPCMKIRCADVGGLWDNSNEQYYENAEPCGAGADASTKGSSKTGMIIGIVVGSVIGVALIGVVLMKMGKPRGQKEFDTGKDAGGTGHTENVDFN